MPDLTPTPREIDVLIAEKIFGFMWVDYEGGKYLIPGAKYEHLTECRAGSHIRIWRGEFLHYVPRYSTDPAASKQVRDRMRELGWITTMEDLHQIVKPSPVRACFRKPGSVLRLYGEAATEEESVALAALRAVEGK